MPRTTAHSPSLNDVITAVINTNALLANFIKSNNKTTPKSSIPLPRTDWQYASTTLVSKYTGHTYNWRELERYCKAHHLTIERETINRLNLNSYPASAWYAVYGIVLGQFY